ncbi:hypothetical protein C0Q70_02550 [Pomacea canaliculata]|uniref:Uncharacterized protein n=1 Tax=Pomacea canaliculata TaxID=400727 RepID=A0A2T7PQD8_POMCA|nr:hypothetical protein C0Q70_02550 [Pomacea canaliculata]
MNESVDGRQLCYDFKEDEASGTTSKGGVTGLYIAPAKVKSRRCTCIIDRPTVTTGSSVDTCDSGPLSSRTKRAEESLRTSSHPAVLQSGRRALMRHHLDDRSLNRLPLRPRGQASRVATYTYRKIFRCPKLKQPVIIIRERELSRRQKKKVSVFSSGWAEKGASPPRLLLHALLPPCMRHEPPQGYSPHSHVKCTARPPHPIPSPSVPSSHPQKLPSPLASCRGPHPLSRRRNHITFHFARCPPGRRTH